MKGGRGDLWRTEHHETRLTTPKINLRRIYASYLVSDSETTKYDCSDTIWQDFVIPKVIPFGVFETANGTGCLSIRVVPHLKDRIRATNFTPVFSTRGEFTNFCKDIIIVNLFVLLMSNFYHIFHRASHVYSSVHLVRVEIHCWNLSQSTSSLESGLQFGNVL